MISMKKIFILGAFALLMTSLFSCSSCKTEKEAVSEEVTLVPEQCVSTDREQMFLEFGDKYAWFETCVVYTNFLDEENDGAIDELANIFQVVTERDSCYDTKVVAFTYNKETNYQKVISGFYVGDKPLNEEQIKLTFADAFEKLMATNLPKPHSRNVVLRKELGPKPCNPQYIFGNLKAQVYVDAVTGDVTDKNPAFEGFDLAAPLGEWP